MKWEYKTLKQEVPWRLLVGPDVDVAVAILDQEMNALGVQGWELTAAFGTNKGEGVTEYLVAIFKRQREQ